MKQMGKRVLAVMLAVVFVLAGVLPYSSSLHTVKAEGTTTIIFHYQRPDKAYDNWDLWVWPDGENGAPVAFSDEDDFGKVAVYQADHTIEKAGFIVRVPDWSDKDVADDRFVEIKDGKAEIWITSGQADFAVTAPEGAKPYTIPEKNPSQEETPQGEAGDGTIYLHYHRYDGNYTNWNLWFWPDGGNGARFEFTGKDDFGVVAALSYDSSVSQYGFIVKKNEWDQKDCDMDRFIDISKAAGGKLDVYLIESDPTVYYDASAAVLEPKFLEADLKTVKTIGVSVTIAVDCSAADITKQFEIVDETGKKYAISSVTSTGDSAVTTSFEIALDEELNLAHSYTLSSKDYGEMSIGLSNLFTTPEFEEQFTYTGNDLGATYTKDKTTFKVWSPTATKVVLNLYKNGTDGKAYETVEMTRGEAGVWSTEVQGDLYKVYYTYSITNAGVERETVDLYARSTGVNGKRGMVVDLSATNPEGWDKDTQVDTVKSASDAIVYELHVRDFTIDPSSGVMERGKFLGLTEKGTKNSKGMPTALDHIIGLGVTHVQILPMYDYSPNSVDETSVNSTQFNWGYDPYNYNVPEGSYSTDPYHGEVRVKEMKQMVQSFHNEKIGVIMDVVYNHTAESADSYFSMTVPDYYYRQNAEGGFSNGSGCGNEVASERAMVRKYIVDSVVYWATEYHIDGFRFDLMGLLDQETMKEIRAELNKVNPNIIVYGEGWTGGGTPLSESERAMKKTMYKLDGIGAFSDDMRDGIKGSVFDAADKGFATGKGGQEERIKASVVGSIDYPGIDWALVGTDVGKWWTNAPSQAVQYVSAHDNLTLWDKINSSNAEDTEEDRVKMNLLAASIVYTSQGMPFMLSGEEILRTKPKESGEGFDENSYKSPDATNSIKWDTLEDKTVADVLSFYKGLIAFRKAHSGLRMATADEVKGNLSFLETGMENVVAFVIDNKPNGECSDKICVIYNANREEKKVSVPKGDWKVCVKDGKAGAEALETFSGADVTVSPISCLVMVQGSLGSAGGSGAADGNGGFNAVAVIAVFVAVAGVAAIGVFLAKKKKTN